MCVFVYFKLWLLRFLFCAVASSRSRPHHHPICVHISFPIRICFCWDSLSSLSRNACKKCIENRTKIERRAQEITKQRLGRLFCVEYDDFSIVETHFKTTWIDNNFLLSFLSLMFSGLACVSNIFLGVVNSKLSCQDTFKWAQPKHKKVNNLEQNYLSMSSQSSSSESLLRIFIIQLFCHVTSINAHSLSLETSKVF